MVGTWEGSFFSLARCRLDGGLGMLLNRLVFRCDNRNQAKRARAWPSSLLPAIRFLRTSTRVLYRYYPRT